MAKEFNEQELVDAFAVVGRTFGQLALVALRFGAGQLAGAAAITAPVEAALLDREGASNYLCVSKATFDELRKTEDFGEFEHCGRPKFPRDKLDAYIKRIRRGR